MEPLSASEPFSCVGPWNIAELVAAARNAPPGCFVEVGVYKGGTAWHLSRVAQEQGRAIYLYDTFTGMPDNVVDGLDQHKAGDFADTSANAIRDLIPYATVIQGEFPHSALPFMGTVALAHLDCDNYYSVLKSAAWLTPKMASGGILWFDDSPILPGAKKAVEELFAGSINTSEHGKHYVIIGD